VRVIRSAWSDIGFYAFVSIGAGAACLKFYVHEHRRHHGILLYEWLLERAKKLGIHGGSAFRAIAGFGRHGILHEDHFFELAGNLPVEFDSREPFSPPSLPHFPPGNPRPVALS